MKSDSEAKASIILDTLRPAKDGNFPVRLRVIYKRKYRDYTMKYPPEKGQKDEKIKRLLEAFGAMGGQTIKMTKEGFRKANGTHPRDIYDSYKDMFQCFVDLAKSTISGIPEFSWEAFEANYFNTHDRNDILAQLNAAANRLRNEGRISTAVSYECTLNSLKEFTGQNSLLFKSITVPFLRKYEKWMLTPRIITWETKLGKIKTREKVCSITTVGIYLRNVRIIFNEAGISDLGYPFGKSKKSKKPYQIPKGKNIKKALTQQQIGMIAGYNPVTSAEERARDMWLFSYLCNGINMKDICRLKYSNIKGDKITLIRAKTAESVEEKKDIEIIITRQIGRIIDRWGVKPADPGQFIFPILLPGSSPEQEYKTISQVVKTNNKYMKRICNYLDIPPATTYVARHSFATILKRSGASVEFISESLGHRNTQTTQNYLANFEDEEKRKWAEKVESSLLKKYDNGDTSN